MDWKNLGKKLLFPHTLVMVLFVPFAIALLVYSMVFVGTETPIAYVSYVFSAYTLTVWCFRIPRFLRFWKNLKNENKYARLWREDARLRIRVSLYGTLAWNAIYGCFQLWLGLYHHTFWFTSFGVYYICLALMRFALVRYTRRYQPGEHMRIELKTYRACGWVLLAMNFALSLIVFFMIHWNRSFEQHMITAIAMAAYTFTAFSISIVNVVKYRRYNSPVFSATTVICFAAAMVSMLTLESTMLTVFGKGSTDALMRKVMLGVTGGVISATLIAMAIYMIVKATRALKAGTRQ